MLTGFETLQNGPSIPTRGNQMKCHCQKTLNIVYYLLACKDLIETQILADSPLCHTTAVAWFANISSSAEADLEKRFLGFCGWRNWLQQFCFTTLRSAVKCLMSSLDMGTATAWLLHDCTERAVAVKCICIQWTLAQHFDCCFFPRVFCCCSSYYKKDNGSKNPRE